jgi:hypothetical protein
LDTNKKSPFNPLAEEAWNFVRAVAYQAKADAPSVALQYHRHAAAPIKWREAAEQGPKPRLKDCSIRVVDDSKPL